LKPACAEGDAGACRQASNAAQDLEQEPHREKTTAGISTMST
jgi:hypothetical protein